MELINDDTTLSSVGEIKLYHGNGVNRVLEDEEFCRAWDELYRNCEWATIFQERDFFIMYHQVYKKKYLPLLVTCQKNGRLMGLLPLSVNNRDLRITGGGVNDAHYHSWISEAAISGSFISKALKAVQDEFPTSPIRLYQLPPKINLDWLETDGEWQGRYHLEPEKRPLVNLKDPSVFKLLKKKDYKSNTNRLKKAGAYEVERVTDMEGFEKALEAIMTLSDFRHGAQYGWLPFKNNPLRKKLYSEMFKSGYLIALVMKLNGEVIAGITGTVGKDGWFHGAGVNCHSPLYSYYSPGFLSFINLVLQLESEGFGWIDLSTGMLDYKKRIANDYDEVYGLEIDAKNPLSSDDQPIIQQVKHLKKTFTNTVWKMVEKKEHLPYERDFIRKKVKVFLKNHDYLPMLNFLGSGNCEADKKSYVFKGKSKNYVGLIDYKINNINHLLCYQPLGLSLTDTEFYRCMAQRFSEKQLCFSHVEKKVLKWCVWEKTTEAENGLSAVQLEIFYCHTAFLPALEDIISTLASNYDQDKISEVTVLVGDKEYAYLNDVLGKRKDTA